MEPSCLFVAEWAVKKGAVPQRATENSRLNWEAWPEARVRQESFGDAAGFQIGPVGPILEVLGEVSVNKGSGRFRERFLALQVGFEQITLHLTGNRQSAYR